MNKRDGKQNMKSGTAPGSTKGSSKKGGQPKIRNTTQRAPVAIGNRTHTVDPKITVMANGNTRVVHSEYYGDLVGSTLPFWIAEIIALNPGMINSFPWLNEIASRFENYKFKKLNVRFLTERPTTESGYVAIVPDYDPHDLQPVSKTAAFQYQGVAKCAPWENMTQVNAKPNLHKVGKEFFVRQGILPGATDIALYDTGNIFICVGGNSGAVTLGEIWIDYEVELYTPQLDSSYGTSRSGYIDGQTLMTGLQPLGVSPLIKFSRDQLCTYNDTTGYLTFLSDYQGLGIFSVVGTGLSGFTGSGSSGIHTAVANVFNTGGTTGVAVWRLDMKKGDTFYPHVSSWTTVTSGELRLAGYRYTLG